MVETNVHIRGSSGSSTHAARYMSLFQYRQDKGVLATSGGDEAKESNSLTQLFRR